MHIYLKYLLRLFRIILPSMSPFILFPPLRRSQDRGTTKDAGVRKKSELTEERRWLGRCRTKNENDIPSARARG